MVFTAAPTVPHSMLSLPPVQGQTTILSGDVWMDIIKTEMYFSRDILIDTRLKPSNCWGKSWIGSNRFPDNQALEKWAQGLEMYKSKWLISNYGSCCSEMAKCSSLAESINWSQRQSACCQTVKAKQGCCLGICGSDRPAATQLFFLVAAASFPKKKSQTSVTL